MADADYDKMSAFSCGVAELDDFFHHEVEQCVEYRYLSAYCAKLNSGEIIAAFTLMNDALMIAGQDDKEDFLEDLRFEQEGHIVDFLSRQPTFPAVNIGHLGVSVDCQGSGVGTAIIDLVVDTFANYRNSGCQFVTVDALRDERTFNFYRKNYFSFQTNKDFYSSTRRMYRILG